MSNAQVDGIKKISREELERSRQAVLAAIAAEEKTRIKDNQTVKGPKKLDGILPKKIFSPAPPAEKEVAVNFLVSEKTAAPPAQPVSIAKKTPEIPPALKTINAPAKPKNESLPDLRTERLLEKKRQEEAALKKLREKQADEARKRELAKRQAEQRKQEEEKQRKREEEKKAEANKRLALLKKEQKKLRRKEVLTKFKTTVKDFFINFQSHLFRLIKILANILALSIVFFLLGYIIFALLLLKFNLDHELARKIENRLTVPAIISEAGIIGYYDYIGIKQKANSENLDITALKNTLAERLLVSDLIRRYQREELDPDDPGDREKISFLMLEDDAINQVAKQRILKIKKLISAEGNFFEIASKFGDEFGKLNFPSLDEAVQKFGENIKLLKNDEASGIIMADNGYYVVMKDGSAEGKFSYSYSYIKGKNLEEYLKENSSFLKMWALLDVK